MTCDTSETQWTYISESVQQCMLPALKEDLDTLLLHGAHFQSYQQVLHQELPKLYDFLQRNEDVLLNAADGTQQQLRAQLILLLCELTAAQTIYKLDIDAEFLLRNANHLLNKLARLHNNDIDVYIFNYYEQKLHKDCWKRQLGATHGFARYLEHRYVAGGVKMSTKLLTFSLAVGLNVRECYEPLYKQLGVRIFTLMLSHSHAADLQQLNIHGVIYEHVFKDVNNLDTLEATTGAWSCLCLCLDHFTELDSFAWNQCDDMLERLIQNVTLAPNAETSICLLHFITRLGCHFTINRSEIEARLAGDFTQPDQMAACRELCAALNSCTSYRWAKSILQMLVLESEKLLQGIEICEQMLNAMMRCYMVCVLSIPLQALHMHLHEFYLKFVSVLLESLKTHENAASIVQLVQQFIDIFKFQLSSSDLPADLNEFVAALDSLQRLIGK